MTKAYCVKCKKKDVEMAGESTVKTKNGRTMIKGKCPTCGTTMCKFVKA
ncbi:MAG: DUF5679 domain-containing protein [Patescibacteria group bacterium]|nr:DUF5679 domain-containing protein [Patescibacteria group bacterium]